MDKNTKKNRNYLKTEEAIITSLINLYKERKNINKITVKDLCIEANISRSTFYLHYLDMISIFESVGDKFVESLKDIVTDISKQETINFETYIYTIFHLINESNELIKIGLSSEYPFVYIENLKRDLVNFILTTAMPTATEKNKQQTIFEIKIIVSGLIDVVISLIKTDELDIHQYANLINNFLTKWTKSLLF